MSSVTSVNPSLRFQSLRFSLNIETNHDFVRIFKSQKQMMVNFGIWDDDDVVGLAYQKWPVQGNLLIDVRELNDPVFSRMRKC